VSLTAGSRLGPYEILVPIGAGGMGEVYRARDTRLERTVAIKVLPPHLASSAESRQRFEREAKTISRLSHPHICALYDVGREDETEYLVMEYLEGETLSDRLVKGALPLDQTLRYGTEIAEALDKAHRQGIVHRDLKPGNVMLTREGVKLLDFGLAKAMAPPAEASGLTSFPTVAGAANLTQQGMILGTFQYMAPEQLEGREADARSDIFAFGAVLYEMATGRKAFTGATQASLIGAILHTEPEPISTLAPASPPALERVVKKCLSKDPEDRWQSAADLESEIQWIAQGSPAPVPSPAGATGRRSRERLAWAIAAALFLAALFFGIGYVRRAPEPPRTLRATLDLPPDTRLDPLNGSLALSPDGRRLVIAGIGADGKPRLWVRSLESLSPQPLTGTDGATYPFWSPDGRFVGFFADRKLRKIDASGGTIQTICDAPDGRGADWGPDGTIVFTPELYGGLARVSSSGGSPTPLESDPGAGISHRLPRFLPDGKHVLFFSTEPKKRGVYVFDLPARKSQFLFLNDSEARYVEPGYLAFIRERNLMVQRFDTRSLKTAGEPTPIAEGVQFNPSRYTGGFSLSGTGVLVYQAGRVEERQLTWLDLDGRKLGTIEEVALAGTLGSFAISPDGARVVATLVGSPGESDLWMIEVARGVRTRFTFGGGNKISPIWSADGRQVAYGIDKGDRQWRLALKDAGGTGDEQEIFSGGDPVGPECWSPDGRTIAFRRQSSETKSFDIWLLNVGDRKARPFLASRSNELGGRFSPDGKWFVYQSNESGRPEAYVVPYPGPGGKWQISTGGLSERIALSGLAWLSNSEVSYVSGDKRYAVTVSPRGQALDIGAPRPILGDITVAETVSDYSIGMKRFLIAAPIRGARSAPVYLVTNWTAGLREQ
jgi:serine/threonine protein kinase/Tol biopolymer transport system component